jgi:hypothetical protein
MDAETVLSIIMGVALAAFSLLVVGSAFLRGQSPEEDSHVRHEPASQDFNDVGEVGLDSIYESIDTLELDYQLGNVLENQYHEQLESYRLQAAAAVKRLIESGNAGPELLLEHEVLAARDSLGNGAATTCAECGEQAPPESGVCPGCGAELAAPPVHSDGAASAR